MDFWQSEIFWPKKYEIWSEMGPYGSVGAHIKTGRSPMAQDHFKTPPGPKRGYIRPKKSQKSLKVRAKPAKFNGKRHRFQISLNQL